MNLTSTVLPLGNTAERTKKVLQQTFITVGGLWAITALTSYIGKSLHLGLAGALALFCLSLVTLFGVFALRNSVAGLALLAVFSGMEGLALGPIVGHALKTPHGASTVLMAATLTAVATFACAVYCRATRRSFSRWGSALFAGLIVLIVAQLLAVFFPIPGMMVALAALSALLFVGYLLYDISAVVTGEQDNYVIAAVQIYLDMLNLFLDLVRLLNSARN